MALIKQTTDRKCILPAIANCYTCIFVHVKLFLNKLFQSNNDFLSLKIEHNMKT